MKKATDIETGATREQVAAWYLQAAAAKAITHSDPIALLVAEMWGAAAYGEGDIAEIAGRLAAAAAAI
jgi:hypothetical protein